MNRDGFVGLLSVDGLCPVIQHRAANAAKLCCVSYVYVSNGTLAMLSREAVQYTVLWGAVHCLQDSCKLSFTLYSTLNGSDCVALMTRSSPSKASSYIRFVSYDFPKINERPNSNLGQKMLFSHDFRVIFLVHCVRLMSWLSLQEKRVTLWTLYYDHDHDFIVKPLYLKRMSNYGECCRDWRSGEPA